MDTQLQLSLLFGITIYFILLYILLKKNKVQLKYILIWLFFGILTLIFTLLPEVIIKVSDFLGIFEITNAIFLIVIFFIIIVLMSLTIIVSALSNKNKELIQTIAILENRLHNLEHTEQDNNYI